MSASSPKPRCVAAPAKTHIFGFHPNRSFGSPAQNAIARHQSSAQIPQRPRTSTIVAGSCGISDEDRKAGCLQALGKRPLSASMPWRRAP
eukprot:1752480-Lingulodinium_polyedra.AAC.1